MVSVCLPSDALSQHYRLTWVSPTLDVGYLLTAAPAKRSLCSLPWTRGIFSRPAPPELEHGVAPPALLRLRSNRSLEVGKLLSAAAPALSQPGALGCYTPDLGRGVAPHGLAYCSGVAAGLLCQQRSV